MRKLNVLITDCGAGHWAECFACFVLFDSQTIIRVKYLFPFGRHEPEAPGGLDWLCDFSSALHSLPPEADCI